MRIDGLPMMIPASPSKIGGQIQPSTTKGVVDTIGGLF